MAPPKPGRPPVMTSAAQRAGRPRQRPSDKPRFDANGVLVVRSHKKKTSPTAPPVMRVLHASAQKRAKLAALGSASRPSTPGSAASTAASDAARKKPVRDSPVMTALLAHLNEIPPILNRNLDLIRNLDFLNIKRARPLNKRQHDLALYVEKLKEELAMQTYELLDQHAKELDRYLLTATHVNGDNKAVPAQSPRSLNMEIDPNEPTYCTCGQVAFGEMISCDDPNCVQEWFHVQCVGVSRSAGPWFCPSCKPRNAAGATAAQ